ncbi:energy-coupling factor ABC transporter ATP-binding protein [Bacillus cytotoxicus]|uniref:Energy-coupling factor transporter ATP-binding protein EcfA n=2 Tax=Bacillus cytotoxicus TaxID=580165 RepID=A0AAX2CBF6_9BACI|nr:MULTISPECIES: energy-coupling factor ABC transporter ATP-binding protein [Bacillus cereus group]ABS20507.1 ABC transporter-related protein [Bacillus cytotoxicus NVH 391-98]AWC27119.1 energy-coupling factor ABC transporter ATP-binding protein [Bacillus cytotoxicus]AWC31178.1 energy-coupling factor ABC transporter ATP-binding protein [Bacillus cytotoxicus]AWC35220.1 energy-coupling factor ABC transporter ATP-binding protein [Bacillus cytotoxicus]AWC39233.1 energy-coupling factor ABC transport
MKREKLRVQNVSFQYPGATAYALKDVSFSLNEGEWVSVIGQNGSGKSTLAKLLNGLFLPESGTITVNGTMALSEETVWDIRKQIGMVFQNPDNQFVGTTVQDDVVFGLENIGMPREQMVERMKQALHLVRMEEFLHEEPHSLSGGQKQRVAIAGILALQPSILILDEATSMLDPKGRVEVVETVRQLVDEKGITVLSITHDLEEAAQSDRIIVLNKGEILEEGTPQKIFKSSHMLKEIGLDVPFSVKIAELLKRSEIPLQNTHLTMESLVNELWRLHSKR